MEEEYLFDYEMETYDDEEEMEINDQDYYIYIGRN